jgi:hypothetical protein
VSSLKPDLRDLAARFARKAESDEIALDRLASDSDVPDDLIGFHAQQALEKLLKAALACAGVAPPRVHDLGKLLIHPGFGDRVQDALAVGGRLAVAPMSNRSRPLRDL